MIATADNTDRTFQVLFLCTHNSCRSVIAECILNQIGQGRFTAHSAGSQPSGQVNRHALAMLQRHGYATAGVRSKSWNEFSKDDAPHFDFIFTVCDSAAGESCPYWPGKPITAHWGVADPSRVEGPSADREAAFEACHRILRRRLDQLVGLPREALVSGDVRSVLNEIAAETVE